jgi:NAD(P)-dependent dehydrogenase (short-subunit alcohol dehydrogenase family)
MGAVLITGASRGIGRALAEACAAAGRTVLATARRPADAPDLGPAVRWLPLDVDDPASIRALPDATGGAPIDLLINNAGIIGQRVTRLGGIDHAVWLATLTTNLLGPVRVLEALLPQLRAGRGRKVATISSRMGSIGANTAGGSYVYRSSKAAVNAAMHSIALDLRSEGFTVVVLHPGWVRTDMGGSGADLDVATSAAGLFKVIERLGPAETGTFWNHDGTPLPW